MRRASDADRPQIPRTEEVNPASSKGDGVRRKPGSVLLSHTLTRAVPSALEGLTSEFEMGSGMAPPTLPPEEVEVSARSACVARGIDSAEFVFPGLGGERSAP